MAVVKKLSIRVEKKLFASGCSLLASLDEAGRGAWAGPVVAAAFFWERGKKIPPSLRCADDSKKMSPQARRDFFRAVNLSDWRFCVAEESAAEIDRTNILLASLSSMKRAVSSACDVSCAIIDGPFRIPLDGLPQIPMVGADAKVWSVAAASIIAKVARDNLMEQYDQLYPGYGFARHKGYGTKEHLAALKELGPCPIHRLSFRPLKAAA